MFVIRLNDDLIFSLFGKRSLLVVKSDRWRMLLYMVRLQMSKKIWNDILLHICSYCYGYFYIVTRGILCQTSKNPNGLTS